MYRMTYSSLSSAPKEEYLWHSNRMKDRLMDRSPRRP